MKKSSHIAALAAVVTAFSAVTTSAQVVSITNNAAISIENPSQTQLSDRAFDYHFLSVSELRANYTAGAFHCSQVRMHFYVDGIEKAVSGILPAGEGTGFLNLGPVTPGRNVLSLRAEGVLGACNIGWLGGWTGGVDVVTARSCDLDWLDIQHKGTTIEISWLSLPCNFVLEATTDEPPTGSWSQVAVTPVLIGDRFVVRDLSRLTRTFYRLRLL